MPSTPLFRSLRQRERHDLAEEAIPRLDQDAGAVAGVRLAAAGPAVLEVDEHLQRLLDDVVRALPLDVHDEPDAAGVALMARVVQTRLRCQILRATARRALCRRVQRLVATEHGRHIVQGWAT